MSDGTEQAVAIDLSDLDAAYEEAEAPEQGDFTEVPDGTYQVRIDKVEIATSRTGNRMLKQQLRIISGEHANRMIFRNNVLETADNMKWLKADLAKMNVEIGKISELPDRLGDLLDITLEVKKVTKADSKGEMFANVYIQKRIAVDGAPGGVTGDMVTSGGTSAPRGGKLDPSMVF